jgi:hypothetical protein
MIMMQKLLKAIMLPGSRWKARPDLIFDMNKW